MVLSLGFVETFPEIVIEFPTFGVVTLVTLRIIEDFDEPLKFCFESLEFVCDEFFSMQSAVPSPPLPASLPEPYDNSSIVLSSIHA